MKSSLNTISNIFLIVLITFLPVNSFEVKVKIFSSKLLKDFKINSKCLKIKDEIINDKVSVLVRGKKIVIITNNKLYEDDVFEIEPCNEIFEVIIKKEKRIYKGKLILYLKNDIIIPVNVVDIDDYILSVVEYETQIMKNIEAIKANAVAARSYVLASYNRRHQRDYYHFCDLTHCQLYKGFQNIRDVVKKAVDNTKGYVILYNGKPAWSMYHSICGGKTEDALDVWGYDSMPYLSSIDDKIFNFPLCSFGWGYRWRTKISKKKIGYMLYKSGLIEKKDEVSYISIYNRSKSGRVKNLIIKTNKKLLNIRGIDFYHLVGRRINWFAIKSTLFDVKYDKKYFIFEGKGYGHGVGMCQHGADKMAELGYSWNDIINHYYKNVEIVKIR
ncbi:MAG: SpoIID/LytB domain-containing protein [Elusimicrobiales bacterium]|nr:SpoIID/LytB domain-containing protein [Elusimicrobiales bacterium]